MHWRYWVGYYRAKNEQCEARQCLDTIAEYEMLIEKRENECQTYMHILYKRRKK